MRFKISGSVEGDAQRETIPLQDLCSLGCTRESFWQFGSLSGRLHTTAGAKIEESLLQCGKKCPKQEDNAQNTWGFMLGGLLGMCPEGTALVCVHKSWVQPSLISFLICDFFGSSPTFFITQNMQKTLFFIIFCVDSHQIIIFSRIYSWMFLVLTLTTLWSSLRRSFTMRRSLGGGGALFLVVTKRSFSDFLEMLLLFFTLHQISICWRTSPLVGISS